MADWRRRGERGQPVLIAFRRPELNRVDDTNDGGLGALTRVESEIPDAARHDQAEIGVLKLALLHGLFHQTMHGGFSEWNLEPDAFGRGVQAIEMLGQAEHSPVVDPDPFEHAVAI